MYNLKFITFFEEGGSVERNIECPHYEVYKRANGIISVTAHTSHLSVDGVEYHISKDDGYQMCYVTNSAGKTVDKITP